MYIYCYITVDTEFLTWNYNIVKCKKYIFLNYYYLYLYLGIIKKNRSKMKMLQYIVLLNFIPTLYRLICAGVCTKRDNELIYFVKQSEISNEYESTDSENFKIQLPPVTARCLSTECAERSLTNAFCIKRKQPSGVNWTIHAGFKNTGTCIVFDNHITYCLEMANVSSSLVNVPLLSLQITNSTICAIHATTFKIICTDDKDWIDWNYYALYNDTLSSLAMSLNSVCVINSVSKLYCNRNTYLLLQVPDVEYLNFSQVSVSEGISCAITIEYVLVCWGPKTFYMHLPLTQRVSFVSVSAQMNCAVEFFTNHLRCWNTGINLYIPEFVIDFVFVRNRVCYLVLDRSVKCLHDNGMIETIKVGGEHINYVAISKVQESLCVLSIGNGIFGNTEKATLECFGNISSTVCESAFTAPSRLLSFNCEYHANLSTPLLHVDVEVQK